jgi:hypothetical protein
MLIPMFLAVVGEEEEMNLAADHHHQPLPLLARLRDQSHALHLPAAAALRQSPSPLILVDDRLLEDPPPLRDSIAVIVDVAEAGEEAPIVATDADRIHYQIHPDLILHPAREEGPTH